MMDKSIINQNPQANGVYEVHNATQGCNYLPHITQQNHLGFFATSDLALKRAKMNWPREKIKVCIHCCSEA